MEQHQAQLVSLMVACSLLFMLRYNLVTRCVVYLYHDLHHWWHGYKRVYVSCDASEKAQWARIDSDYWMREYGVKFVPVASNPFTRDTHCVCINCVERTAAYRLDTERLFNYMQLLADGRGNPVERVVWRYFTRLYPVTPWELRHTVRRRNYLPEWIVSLVDIYNSVYVRCALGFICLYALALLTLHLWLPHVMLIPVISSGGNASSVNTNSSSSSMDCEPVGFPPPTEFTGTVRTTRFSDALGRLVYDCGKFVRSGEHDFDVSYPFCLLQRRQAWYSDAHSRIDYSTLERTAKHGTSPQTAHFFDMDGLAYHVFGAPDATGRRIVPTLVQRRLLLEWLEYLRIHHSLACVCPLFLGLVDDSVVLYDEASAHWIIMREPRIIRNDTSRGEVESTLLYNERAFHRNPLYDNYRAFTAMETGMAGTSKLRHYARYEVQYELDAIEDGAPSTQPHYRLYDQRLLEYDTVANGLSPDDPLERTVLLTIHTASPASRISEKRVIEGEQAICFNFCHRANKRFIE